MSTHPQLMAGPVATAHGHLGLSTRAKVGIGLGAGAVIVIAGIVFGCRTINRLRMW